MAREKHRAASDAVADLGLHRVFGNAQSSGDVTLVGYTGTVLYLYNYDVSLIA